MEGSTSFYLEFRLEDHNSNIPFNHNKERDEASLWPRNRQRQAKNINRLTQRNKEHHDLSFSSEMRIRNLPNKLKNNDWLTQQLELEVFIHGLNLKIADERY